MPRVVLLIVGTRPNFMKMAPIMAALRSRAGFRPLLVHTGQHYDQVMSEVFFQELGLATPDYELDIMPGSHIAQTATIMQRLEPVFADASPDLVLVSGDVNSTMASALAAVQSRLPVGHVEAGLRSFDRTMPEEINRCLTDQISDLLFIHSPEARVNLLNEARPAEAIHNVGNTMIDTLVTMHDRIAAMDVAGRLGLRRGEYVVTTLHRPALVDDVDLLMHTVDRLRELAGMVPVVFPMHPRTRKAMDAHGACLGRDVVLLKPLGYTEFLSLVSSAAGVLTDSGGLQEETTWLGVPCLTLRDNTERPITVSQGTNTLLGLDPDRILEVPDLLESARRRARLIPEGWDGRAAERLTDVLEEWRP